MEPTSFGAFDYVIVAVMPFVLAALVYAIGRYLKAVLKAN